MNAGLTSRYFLAATLVFSLAACSSSDDDDSPVADGITPETPAMPGDDTPQSDPSTPALPIAPPAAPGASPTPDAPIDDPATPIPADPAPTDPEPADPAPTDPEPADPAPTDPEPVDPAPTGPILPPAAPGVAPNPDPTAAPEPLIPPVTPGSSLDRLIIGLTRQASLAILDLNRRLSQGETLTAQQNECLGAFEGGNGQPLTEISCNSPLVIEGVPSISVGQAAFYNTPACIASLFDQNTNDCVLQRINVEVAPEFVNSADTIRPQLVFAGSRINYAIGNTSLRLNNSNDALTGVFSCEYSLETVAQLNADGADCDSVVDSSAAQIEKLQN